MSSRGGVVLNNYFLGVSPYIILLASNRTSVRVIDTTLSPIDLSLGLWYNAAPRGCDVSHSDTTCYSLWGVVRYAVSQLNKVKRYRIGRLDSVK